MKQFFQGSFILLLVILLFGCSEDKPVESSKDTNKKTEQTGSENDTKENSAQIDSGEDLSTEAMYKIFVELLIQIDMRMDKVYAEHAGEWEAGEWMSKFSSLGEKTEEFLEAEAVVQKELEPYFTEEGNEQLAQFYLEKYFCACDTFTTNEIKDLRVRFEGEQMNEDQFTVSFIELATYEGPVGFPGGTNTYILEKVDDTWRISDYKMIPPDKKPLNITKEELAKDLNLQPEQIEEKEINGETHLIAPFGGEDLTINAKDSSPMAENS